MKVIIDSQILNQQGENLKIDLRDVIDNRNDEYVIYPIEITYYVGYFNISDELDNNKVIYSNGTTTNNIYLPNGLYTLKHYFDIIKIFINNIGDNASFINYFYHDHNGGLIIYVTPPYTFSILQHQISLLGFDTTQIITNSATSINPVNFLPHKMLYIHLKQLKNNYIFYNNNKSDILARVPITNDEFGTLVSYKFDLPNVMELDNTTINTLELSITDENNNIIDFHGMPIFYTFEICKKNKL